MRCIGEVEQLDVTLASFAPAEAALRLRLGQVLDVLCSEEGRGAVFELGFSSLGAYALERCERSVRWVEAARCLARRVEQLPELRRAMALGRHGGAYGSVSWSMGELLARVALPRDEGRWIQTAEGRTVREMRVLVLEALAGERAGGGAGSAGQVAMLGARAREDVQRAEAARGDEAARHAAMLGGPASEGAGHTEAERDGECAQHAEHERGGACAQHAEHARIAAAERDTEGTRHADAERDAECAQHAEGARRAEDEDSEALCTLTVTVDQEEAWLFEATRALLGQLGTHGADAQVEALLAEGQGTLLAALPRGTLDLDGLESVDAAQRRWLEELRRWRAQAEVLCEEHIRGAVLGGGKPVPVQSAVAVAASLGMAGLEHMGCHELDGTVRELSRALARHELELSLRVSEFHRADGWRRLGYASETQYARERLGMSRSSLVARRALAVRLEALPLVAEALGAGHIGVEAAVQVVRVATPRTEAAWVERARQRTIKHLREEVVAALTAVRLSGEADCPPPLDGEIVAFRALEQAVVSGRACQQQPANDAPVNRDVDAVRLAEPTSEQRRAWLVMLASLSRWLDGGLQLSAGHGRRTASGVGVSAGRLALRLRVSRANYTWWHGLEAQARRWLPCGMSWLRFLCLSLWQAWQHLLGTGVAYDDIYIRDCRRCTSPVCSRRDVTPHHLQFRSAGGSDDPANVSSVCLWCHLFGVHGGRIRAVGPAERIRWELGPPGRPCLIVNGRERVAA